MTQARVSILGGGIGGLTLAIALQRKGFTVSVYEAAPQIKPLGAGLALAANAIKAFMEIGISEQIIRAGKTLKLIRIKDQAGNTLTETDSEKVSARFGVVNNFTIHRADLHQVLIKNLAPGSLRLNKQCIDYEDLGTEIVLKFKDGTSVRTEYVIASDGIHSVIRRKLLPEVRPRYAGYTCWRAVINKVPESVDMDETTETWGPGTRFGIVPLSKNRVYWFACVNAPANDKAMRSYTVDNLLQHFAHYHSPIGEIINNTDTTQMIWNDIIDIKPLKQFAFGNILLIGDAAHATTPNMGQGACMAIEDAAILANCLEGKTSVPHAFRDFEGRRIGRTTRIVNNSWNIGKVAQLENKFLISLRNAALKLTPDSVTENQMKFLTNVNFR